MGQHKFWMSRWDWDIQLPLSPEAIDLGCPAMGAHQPRLLICQELINQWLGVANPPCIISSLMVGIVSHGGWFSLAEMVIGYQQSLTSCVNFSRDLKPRIQRDNRPFLLSLFFHSDAFMNTSVSDALLYFSALCWQIVSLENFEKATILLCWLHWEFHNKISYFWQFITEMSFLKFHYYIK